MFVWLAVLVGAAFLLVLALYSGVSKIKERSAAMEHSTRELLLRLQSVEGAIERTERTLGEGLAALRTELRANLRDNREELAARLDAFARQISNLTQSTQERLELLQTGNEEKLEKMRAVVDEKLHATLEQRLGEAFANVSERLEKVHQGLGEMKAVAGDVGDLKRVLSNVKIRGTWGEIQLGNLLEQILAPGQYGANVAVRPGSPERVEFAVRLPGGDGAAGDMPVWLPIDSKFPQEDYLRLVSASEAGDAVAVAEARKGLERRLLEEGRSVCVKYVEPPYTTDFAIVYLPVEGLYAEVLRMDGLCERLMRDHRAVIAGPTTIAALLNSLQMGFRTLAIRKQSSDIWALLGQVKTEFGKFGDVLAKTREKIEQAGREIGNAEVRTRAIERKLRKVESVPLVSGDAPCEGELPGETESDDVFGG